MNKEFILVNVSGQDQPGITSNLMKMIVKGNHTIVDIGQSVTHGLLSLSILIDVNPDSQDSLLKDMLFEAKKLKIELDFSIIESAEAEKIAKAQVKHIISCVSMEGLKANYISDISEVFARNKINIKRIDNVSEGEFKSLDILTNSPKDTDWATIKSQIITISSSYNTDVAFQKDDVFRWNKRLIVFDMDSTLIQAEVIDEIAKEVGCGDQVAAITERAMNGELDFSQSLIERVKLLKGLDTDKLTEILHKLPITEGVDEFLKTVKSLGYKTAVISGGFTFFANGLKDKLGLDYAFANQLGMKDGKLTGTVEGQIVNAEHKAFLLEFLAQQEGIQLDQVVAIGDGANDLPMLSKAGLGIAFHAKQIVRDKSEQQMSHGPMTSILYFLGIPGPQNYANNV
jgi:phosphoserine phosphatase